MEETCLNKRAGMSAGVLKYIALVSMTLDHIGVILYPNVVILRILGRLAFPIFAFMIAEGYRYSSDRKKYFLSIFGVGALLQVFYFLFLHSLYQSVLITFSFSIMLLFVIDLTLRKRISIYILPLVFLFVYFVSEILPVIGKTDFEIDYGFFGIILPVLIFLSANFYVRMGLFSFGLILLSLAVGGIQWFSLLSVLLLSLYNGKRGRRHYKYLFYLYYPLHLSVIYFIGYFFFN